VPEETDVDVSEALVGDEDFDWAIEDLWDEIEDVVDGRVTMSAALGESQFAIARIGPSTTYVEVDRDWAVEVANAAF
jgi:altronate dehydratase large subunit